MVKFFSKCLGASILLASTAAANGVSSSDDSSNGCNHRVLTYPEVIDVDDLSAANKSLTLALEWMEIDPGFGDFHGYEAGYATDMICGSTPFRTRALGGSVPGPTLKVSPGTSMRIKFRNKLTYQPTSHSSRIVIATNGALEGEKPSYATTTELDLTRLNMFNDPDVSNLHFHGLHVSSVVPSNDMTLEVLPHEEYDYVIEIPEDHEPGLHWVHPLHHGSSTLQLAGGAALALIVKDPNEETSGTDTVTTDTNSTTSLWLPAEIREATERVLIFQDWDINEAINTANRAGDMLLMESFSKITGGESIGKQFFTVNGKYQPIMEIQVGKWERMRILYAGWQNLPLQLGITPEGNGAGCEFYLLAKDGIYLSDYPRGPMMSTYGKDLPIPPGGRADFMVRCNNPRGITRFEALSRRNILTINCVDEGSGVGDYDSDDDANLNTTLTPLERDAASSAALVQRSTAPLTPWSKTSSDLPGYLQPVDGLVASDECSCETKFEEAGRGSVTINKKSYRPGNHFMHTTYLGAVVERSLKGTAENSYHQHVYPFQLIDFPNNNVFSEKSNDDYFRIGDWHDTYMDPNQIDGPVLIRYRTTDIPGTIMVHCSTMCYLDMGCLQKEYVRNVREGRRCTCNIFDSIIGDGIIDDIEHSKVIGAVDVSSSRPGLLLGVTHLVPVLVAAAGVLLGIGV